MINGSKATTPANENNFKRFDYGDPDAPPVSYPAAINGINTLKPHVIYLLGTTETINDMMVGIEAGWDDANPRPIYLLADGALVQEVTDAANSVAAKATTPPLRKRIYGTVPGTSNENFQTFRILYDSRIKDGSSASTGGAANAYDAVYNIAYSVVAAGDKPITGAVIRDGFAKLVPPGTPLTAGAANINTAFQKLANGEKIDFAGASGPLDYDLTTGEASSDIQIWCLPPESSAPGANAGPGRSTPVSYDAQGQALAGGNFSSISSFCKLTQ